MRRVFHIFFLALLLPIGVLFQRLFLLAQSPNIKPLVSFNDTTLVEKKTTVRSAVAKRDSLLDMLRRYEAEKRVDTSLVRVLCALSSEFLSMNPVRSLDYAKYAQSLAEKLRDRRGMAYALEGIGRAYRVQGLYSLSLEHFFAMQHIGEESHDKRLQMVALRRIGWNYVSAYNYEAALRYTERALALSRELADTLEEGLAINTIGQVLMEQKQYDRALENFTIALAIARKYAYQDPSLLTYVTENFAQVYSRRGEFAKARGYFQQALEVAERLNNNVYMAFYCRMLGQTLVQEGRYQEARRYAERALLLADSLNIGLDKDAVFALLADVHAGLGNAQQALQYYKHSAALKDSTAGVASAQKAATLESAFQQEKSDKIRERLEAANQQQAIIRNAVIAVGILLAVLLGVLLNRYRLKVRSEEQLRRINADIQRQQSLLEEQSRRIEEMNTELQENNARLWDTNVELDTANTELHSYIEELSRINAELDARNETLSEMHREKNEFLGIVAHDLKNPLVAIRLTSEMLQRFAERMPDSEKMERLKHISGIVDRMIVIINNLLDINALETGILAVSSTTVNISDAIATLEREYKERAALKSIWLESRLPAAGLVFAQADQTMLFTVLENLLSNALKFSPSNTTVTLSSHVTTATTTDGSNAQVCRIMVHDEGPGLSEADKTKLFGKFTRLSARPTNGEHSTGLGLSIVKKMVEAMHGRVWCESELGQGATFIVELPQAEGK